MLVPSPSVHVLVTYDNLVGQNTNGSVATDKFAL